MQGNRETAWTKANGLGNNLSAERFTGKTIFPAITAARVDGRHLVLIDLEMVTKYSHNQGTWAEKCGRLLAMVIATIGATWLLHLHQLYDNFTEDSKANIGTTVDLIISIL